MHMKKKVARLAKHYLSSTGSTLIELLIATMIVGTIVTAVAAGVTNSVKNNAESRYREIATVLAQQAMEVMRSERSNLGWANFYDQLSDGTYCAPTGMDELSDLSGNMAACTITESNYDFTRQVVLTKTNGADPAVMVEITVSWERRAGAYSDVKVTQTFKNYTKN